MAADKGKKMKLEKGEEENHHIDEELVLSIEKLQEIQDELEKINEEASDKVLEVEQKYNVVRKPVYEKRNEIIKSIPDFWLTAFLSHPALGNLLSEEDQKVFKHLTSLEVEDCKDVKSGYSITFVSLFFLSLFRLVRISLLLPLPCSLCGSSFQNFEANPYFEDAKLTKTFTFLDEGTTEISATPIKWKEGMALPNGVTHEKKGNKRPLAEESFFSWFSNTQPKDMMEDMQDELAEIIKEDLWPNPLAYFNTDPDEEDFEGDEGDKDGDDSDEDDDEQDDEEDDGEDEEAEEE
ncbi:NAP1-related protein 2 [Linum grandiflorum]